MGGSVLIAILEDELIIRELLGAALEDAGYSVALFASGEEAVAMLEARASEFRALITDVRLGGKRKLTGWDVAHRARELKPDMPIIYTSGDSGIDWTAQGVPKSVMVTKPYVVAQIITAVSQLLNECR